MWTYHVKTGNDLHKGSKLVVILWEQLDNFISREEHHPLYPCRFNAEVIRQNMPNSLRSPRAHNLTLVIKFNLLPSILHCQCFNPHIIPVWHFFVYHSLTQLFARILHWRPYVIHKGLHVILCHSGLKIHNLLFDCMTSKY